MAGARLVSRRLPDEVGPLLLQVAAQTLFTADDVVAVDHDMERHGWMLRASWTWSLGI